MSYFFLNKELFSENEWEDLCQNGGEQSPIDLPKVDLEYRDVGEIRCILHSLSSAVCLPF